MNRCRVCALPPDRLAALRSSLRAGEGLVRLAKRFGLSPASLSRHVSTHEAKVDAITPAAVLRDEKDLEIEDLRREYYAALEEAKAAGAVDVTVKVLRLGAELVKMQDERAERMAARQYQTAIDLRMVAAFATLRRAVAVALDDFPDARARLATVLLEGPRS